jgi:hypothetical protein
MMAHKQLAPQKKPAEQAGKAHMSNILAIIDLDTSRERGQTENLMVVI